MKKALLTLSILLLLISCEKKNDKIQKEETKIEKDTVTFFDPTDLGAFGSPIRLLIYANFDECGEWGGHEESFEFFAKEDRKFYVSFKRSKVDCDKRLYGRPIQQPEISKEIQLSKSNIIAVNNYISKLVHSKIKERYPGHAGQSFGVIKTDSTFMINVYDNNNENLDNYNKLLESFKIEKVSYKNH